VRDGAALVAAARGEIAREPLARPEYVALVDADTLAAVPVLDGRALLALAVWVGTTRLIDNRMLTVPAVSRERRSA
jgi:pantoate--beta-alanine ligase